MLNYPVGLEGKILDLHCFQLSFISGFILHAFKEFIHGTSKLKAKLSSLCIIYSLGQIKFSLDKYIMAIYLSLGKYMYKILLFPQSTDLPSVIVYCFNGSLSPDHHPKYSIFSNSAL